MECLHSIYSYPLKRSVPLNQTKSLKLRMKSPYPYSLVLPALIVYGVLYVLPAASGFLLSFFNVKTFKISSFTFAGLENYATVLRNPYFSVAIKTPYFFPLSRRSERSASGWRWRCW